MISAGFKPGLSPILSTVLISPSFAYRRQRYQKMRMQVMQMVFLDVILGIVSKKCFLIRNDVSFYSYKKAHKLQSVPDSIRIQIIEIRREDEWTTGF